jgi:hypothetical protein
MGSRTAEEERVYEGGPFVVAGDYQVGGDAQGVRVKANHVVAYADAILGEAQA